MFQGHSTPLALAYVVGLGGWLVVSRVLPNVWPAARREEAIDWLWKDFAFALLGGVGVIAVGQLWGRGIRLPEEGPVGPPLAAINQLLIFLPMLLVVVIRRQPWTTAWLPRGRLPLRLLTGIVLSSLAVTAYSLLRSGADAPWTIIGRIWTYDHIDEMAQVFLEDLTIAILFIRLAGVIGKRWAIILVACLFAAGHIPAMISQGAPLHELWGLVRDAGLGVMAILVLQRSGDVVWFCCIHFCLDMTQFAAVSGVG